MRYLFSLLVGGVIVFGLFLFMQMLVKGARWSPEAVIVSEPIEFVRLKREEAVQPKQRRVPEKPPEPETPPPPRVRLDQALAPPDGGITVSVPRIDTSFKASVGGAFFNAQTTAVIPLARVQPQYPRQALIDGTEGWVEVEFTITEFGTVEDPRVVDSQPRGIFENSALRAIVRWKFKPKIESGVAVRFPRARYRLEFQMAPEDPR